MKLVPLFYDTVVHCCVLLSTMGMVGRRGVMLRTVAVGGGFSNILFAQLDFACVYCLFSMSRVRLVCQLEGSKHSVRQAGQPRVLRRQRCLQRRATKAHTQGKPGIKNTLFFRLRSIYLCCWKSYTRTAVYLERAILDVFDVFDRTLVMKVLSG